MVIPNNQLQAFNQATAVALGRTNTVPTQTAAPTSLLSGVSPLAPQAQPTLGIQSLTPMPNEGLGLHYGYNNYQNQAFNFGQAGQFGGYGMMGSLFGMMNSM